MKPLNKKDKVVIEPETALAVELPDELVENVAGGFVRLDLNETLSPKGLEKNQKSNQSDGSL